MGSPCQAWHWLPLWRQGDGEVLGSGVSPEGNHTRLLETSPKHNVPLPRVKLVPALGTRSWGCVGVSPSTETCPQVPQGIG